MCVVVCVRVYTTFVIAKRKEDTKDLHNRGITLSHAWGEAKKKRRNRDAEHKLSAWNKLTKKEDCTRKYLEQPYNSVKTSILMGVVQQVYNLQLRLRPRLSLLAFSGRSPIIQGVYKKDSSTDNVILSTVGRI